MKMWAHSFQDYPAATAQRTGSQYSYFWFEFGLYLGYCPYDSFMRQLGHRFATYSTLAT
jgi:hypothetical protein